MPSARLPLTYARYPGIGAVLPAMGYGDEQLAELGATVRQAACDVVVIGTPMDLAARRPWPPLKASFLRAA